jgi:hypothetical protein
MVILIRHASRSDKIILGHVYKHKKAKKSTSKKGQVQEQKGQKRTGTAIDGRVEFGRRCESI